MKNLLLLILLLLPTLVPAATNQQLPDAARTDWLPVQQVWQGGPTTRGAVSVQMILDLIDTGDVAGLQTYITGTLGIELAAKDDLTAAEIEGLLDAYFGGSSWRTGGTETDPVFSAWDKDYIDLINPPTTITAQQTTDITTNNAKVSYPGPQDISGKQDNITLTTTGSSGAATLVGSTLNIPQYAVGGGGHTIEDEKLDLAQRGSISFEGAGITATDDAANDRTIVTVAPGAAPIDTVFGRTGTVAALSGDYTADQVTETATRVFVTPAEKTIIGNTSGTNSGDQVVPTALADLVEDATHRVVTDSEKVTWDAKQTALTAGVDYLAPTGDGSGLTGVTKPADLGSAATVDTGTTEGTVPLLGVGGALNIGEIDLPLASDYKIGGIPMTAADIGGAAALGVDDNYVTDAEKIVIGNTSGVNTGDQDLSGKENTGVAQGIMDTHETTHPAPTSRDTRNQIAGSYITAESDPVAGAALTTHTTTHPAPTVRDARNQVAGTYVTSESDPTVAGAITNHAGNTAAHHVATQNTDAESKCVGTGVFLDGEGNCTSAATTASDVPVIDVSGFYSSTDVEGALQEAGAAVQIAPLLTDSDFQARITAIGTGGGTIYLGEGTFEFQCDDNIAYDFSQTDGVTVIGAGQGSTILKWPDHCGAAETWSHPNGLGDSNGKWMVLPGNNFKIQDLTIDGNHWDDWLLARTQPQLQIENQTITNLGATQEGCGGIFATQKKNIVIENIEIVNTSYGCVSSYDSENIIIRDSELHDTYHWDANYATASSGLFVAGGDYANEYDWHIGVGLWADALSTDIYIYNTNMHHIATDIINTSGSNNVQIYGGSYTDGGIGTFTNDWDACSSGGVYFSHGSKNIIVNGAYFSRNGEFGLQLNGREVGGRLSNIVITNNIFEENEEGGMAVLDSDNVIVTNNIAINNSQGNTPCNDGSALAARRQIGFYIADSSSVSIASNLAIDTQGTPTQTFGFYYFDTGQGIGGNSINANRATGNSLGAFVGFGDPTVWGTNGVTVAPSFFWEDCLPGQEAFSGGDRYTCTTENAWMRTSTVGDEWDATIDFSTTDYPNFTRNLIAGTSLETAIVTESYRFKATGTSPEAEVIMSKYSPAGGSLSYCHYETGLVDEVWYKIDGVKTIVTADMSAPCTTVAGISYPAGNVEFSFGIGGYSITTIYGYLDDLVFNDNPVALSADLIGTSQLNDGADIPLVGECLVVSAMTGEIEYAACSGAAQPASNVTVDTTNFNGAFGSGDNSAQAVFDKLDDVTTLPNKVYEADTSIEAIDTGTDGQIKFTLNSGAGNDALIVEETTGGTHHIFIHPEADSRLSIGAADNSGNRVPRINFIPDDDSLATAIAGSGVFDYGSEDKDLVNDAALTGGPYFVVRNVNYPAGGPIAFTAMFKAYKDQGVIFAAKDTADAFPAASLSFNQMTISVDNTNNTLIFSWKDSDGIARTATLVAD